MAVKIKLMRMGKIRAPQYRIVVADARTKRDGRAIETIGKYHPTHDPSFIEVDSERAQYWLSVGAQPTEPVAAILRVTGDWQKFKGLPGAEGTLRVAEPKPSKKLVYEEAARQALGEGDGEATTPKAKKSKKADEAKKADEGKADDGKADEAPKADEAKADEKPAADAAEAPAPAEASTDAPATAEAAANPEA